MDESESGDENRTVGKGQVLFTGPDGIGDFHAKVEEQRYVGIGTMSPEGTSDVNYLCRPAPECPPPAPKGACVGEVGWGLKQLTDISLLKTGHQIARGEFRQAVEDRHTHLYQNPWYPAQWEREKDSMRNVIGSPTSVSSTSTLEKA
eukprot:m.309452 g.309452  ORF g.309452 m.309452 type:complete len:147 (+) comp46538_c0_seq1:78-518(+)